MWNFDFDGFPGLLPFQEYGNYAVDEFNGCHRSDTEPQTEYTAKCSKQVVGCHCNFINHKARILLFEHDVQLEEVSFEHVKVKKFLDCVTLCK